MSRCVAKTRSWRRSPAAGTVFLEGADYRQIPLRELRRRVGMVTQRAFLFPGAVYQNVGFGPMRRGEVISEARAEELLARVGLSGYAERDVPNLSGGEAQRVSLLIPVGSMLIANAMNTNGLALNRFRSDVLGHVGEIETALALGADPRQSVAEYVQASFDASLIPAIDSLRSPGIVWIPGLMAGMLLSGSRPIYAAVYQFVVLAMIFAASGLTSLVSTLLIRTHAFTDAEQLLLRPGTARAGASG